MASNELDIARDIRDGKLPSPQWHANLLLIALRITGTGVAYRGGETKEFAYRDPAHYLTEDFLERCQGLAVIWDHPDKRMLNSEEFNRRVIGSILLPYIDGDSVWGIAKIYDAGAAEDLTTRQLSTSPSVVIGDDSFKQKLGDGSILLMEGPPKLLDHLAICTVGTWDKGRPPSGVRADNAVPSDESIRRQIAELSARIPVPLDDAARERIARDEVRADRLSQAFLGERRKLGILQGESEPDYRSRLINPLLKHTSDFKDSDFSKVRDLPALNAMTDKAYSYLERRLKHDPSAIPPGELRKVVMKDEWGRNMTTWYGDPMVAYAPFCGTVQYGRINSQMADQARAKFEGR